MGSDHVHGAVASVDQAEYVEYAAAACVVDGWDMGGGRALGRRQRAGEVGRGMVWWRGAMCKLGTGGGAQKHMDLGVLGGYIGRRWGYGELFMVYLGGRLAVSCGHNVSVPTSVADWGASQLTGEANVRCLDRCVCAKTILGSSLYKYMPILASRIHPLPPP